jgi:hypothetical protein
MPKVVNGCVESNGAKVLILFVEINSWLKTKTNSLLIAVCNKTGFVVVTIINFSSYLILCSSLLLL